MDPVFPQFGKSAVAAFIHCFNRRHQVPTRNNETTRNRRFVFRRVPGRTHLGDPPFLGLIQVAIMQPYHCRSVSALDPGLYQHGPACFPRLPASSTESAILPESRSTPRHRCSQQLLSSPLHETGIRGPQAGRTSATARLCPGDLSSNLNDTIFCPQNRAMQDFAISRTSACHCTIGFSLGVSWGYSFLALHFVG
jgi:hypothetical protein